MLTYHSQWIMALALVAPISVRYIKCRILQTYTSYTSHNLGDSNTDMMKMSP